MFARIPVYFGAFFFIFVIVDALRCYECSSHELKDCETPHEADGELPSRECELDATSCFTKIEDETITRGCTPATLIDSNDNNPSITFCSSDKCNDDNGWTMPEFTIFETTFSEYFPGGRDTLLCFSSSAGPSLVKCNSSSGCYHQISNGHVIRGCVTEIEDENERMKCVNNDDECKTCFETGCNNKESFIECAIGESKPPGDSDMKLETRICKLYEDSCFIRMNQDETVTYGCVHEYSQTHNLLLKSENNNKYRICHTSNCNKMTVPLLLCHSCDSKKETNCGGLQFYVHRSKKCPIEFTPSGCFHHIYREEKHTSRGCIAKLRPNERELCETNTDECKMCLGNLCNIRVGFQTCHASDSYSSAFSPNNICKEYTNQCFIHLSGGRLRKGCMSDKIEGVNLVEDCKNPEICETCSSWGNNCNSRKIEYSCLECSSEDDIMCSYYPRKNMSVECPISLRASGCYLSKESPTVVRRGCMSSLNETMRSNCNQKTGACKVCKSGDNCNLKAHFQKCYECVDCATLLHTAASVIHRECPDYMSQCYTILRDTGVLRGCVGDTIVTSPEMCALYPTTCKTCTENLCNSEKIIADICLVCNSNSDPKCHTNPKKTRIASCPLTIPPLGCFHFINGPDHHERGCVADVNGRMPNDRIRSENCKTCMGAACNSRTHFAQCLHCQGFNCARSLDSSSSRICGSYNDDCYTFIGKITVSRGCVDEYQAFPESLKKERRDKLSICPTDRDVNCNNVTFIPEFCIECDSATNSRCRTDGIYVGVRICNAFSSLEKMGCYLNIENDSVERGCVQDLDLGDRKNCSGKSDTCKICIGDGCHLETDFHKCYVCNSKDDVHCVGNEDLGSLRICDEYYSQCVTGIDESGFTYRRCAAGDENDWWRFLNRYETCDGKGCNNRIFPSNRLQCYQCKLGDSDCNQLPDKSLQRPKPCAAHLASNQCFSYYDGKGMHRGCLSDMSEARVSCQTKTGKTHTCEHCNESGCNNHPLLRPAELDCVVCADSTACAYGQNILHASRCISIVPFGTKETCFTYISKDKKVQRGCTLDFQEKPEGYEDSADFRICNERGCNNENVEYQMCAVCGGEMNGDCSLMEGPDRFIEQCHGHYKYDKRGCYTIKRDNMVSRGCIKELNNADFEKCRREEWCDICTKNYCNINPIRSSSRTNYSCFWNNLVILTAAFAVSSIRMQY